MEDESNGITTSSNDDDTELAEHMSFFGWFFREFKWILRVVFSSCDRFYWDNGFSKAAALAYTTLFSLVPLSVFGFGILASIVLANESLLQQVRSFIIRQFVPSAAGADDVLGYLATFSQQVMGMLRFDEDSFRVSVFALIFLVVSCMVLINSVEYALNQVWQVFEARSISHKISVFCTFLVLSSVLAVSAFYTSIFLGQHFGGDSQLLDSLDRHLMPFVIDCFVFAIVYYLVPKAPVKFRSAIFGAFIAALLFDLAKFGFTVYISHFSSYQRIYGTISTIVIFLFWLYLSWTIVLFGAELSYQVQFLPKKGPLVQRSLLSVGVGKLALAVQALVLIARAFKEGRKLPNDLELAEMLGCSSVVLRPALAALKKAEIISQSDNREGAISLSRSPDKISIKEIYGVLLKSFQKFQCSEELSLFFSFLGHSKPTSEETLADVINLKKGEK